MTRALKICIFNLNVGATRVVRLNTKEEEYLR